MRKIKPKHYAIIVFIIIALFILLSTGCSADQQAKSLSYFADPLNEMTKGEFCIVTVILVYFGSCLAK